MSCTIRCSPAQTRGGEERETILTTRYSTRSLFRCSGSTTGGQLKLHSARDAANVAHGNRACDAEDHKGEEDQRIAQVGIPQRNS